MPLDSHSYLVSQGWGGKGNGLRQGAISRPLAIPQKKTLAGLGKDRDEAFPFWDHLFMAASKSIQIKCLSDDEEDNGNLTNSELSNNKTSMKCTSTGIFSNRRPMEGTPATSGSITPENPAQSHRLGLLATAKRDAAKRGLYSKFFRGPVLGPDTIIEEEKRLTALISQAFSPNDSVADTVSVPKNIETQTADSNVRVDLEASKSLEKKRKSHETKESRTEVEDKEIKRERKRRKKEKKAASHTTEKGHKKEKRKEKLEDQADSLGQLSPPPILQRDPKLEDLSVLEKNGFSGDAIDDERLTDHKRQKKEDKKRLKKLEKTQAKDAENLKTLSKHNAKLLATNFYEKQTKPEEIGVTALEVLDEPKKRKKKRKHADAD